MWRLWRQLAVVLCGRPWARGRPGSRSSTTGQEECGEHHSSIMLQVGAGRWDRVLGASSPGSLRSWRLCV